MEKYKLLNVLKKKKGIQIHVFEVKEECTRIIYLDSVTLEPLKNQCCPKQLMIYLGNQEDKIEMELEATVAV